MFSFGFKVLINIDFIDRQHFSVGGNSKCVVCLAALLESDLLPLNHCAPPILGMGHLLGMLLETVLYPYYKSHHDD